jgi:hypothetical protein
MSNIFSTLKSEAVTLFHKCGPGAHQEVVSLIHKLISALEAGADKEAPVVGAAIGGLLGGPGGAAIGAGLASVAEAEVPKLGAAVEQKVDAEVPK